MSNMSANYISENEMLEAIYNQAFEEKQQARGDKRNSANKNFLGGLSKQEGPSSTAEQDIIDKIISEDVDALKNYSRDAIISSLRIVYSEGQLDFFACLNIL